MQAEVIRDNFLKVIEFIKQQVTMVREVNMLLVICHVRHCENGICNGIFTMVSRLVASFTGIDDSTSFRATDLIYSYMIIMFERKEKFVFLKIFKIFFR